MKLAQVAEQTTLSVSYLSDLERGKATPSLQTLVRLAHCYDISLASLIGEKTQACKHGELVTSWTLHTVHWACPGCNRLLTQHFPINAHFHLTSCPCGLHYRVTWEEAGDDATIFHHVYVDVDVPMLDEESEP